MKALELCEKVLRGALAADKLAHMLKVAIEGLRGYVIKGKVFNNEDGKAADIILRDIERIAEGGE